MYKPIKRFAPSLFIGLLILSTGYIIGVSSNGQNPTIDQDLGIFNFPWFNASIGINAPKYVLNDVVDLTDILEYPKQVASYIIFKEGSTTYAKNGDTGQIDYSGTESANVIQSAVSLGGNIFIKTGEYNVSSPINVPSYTYTYGAGKSTRLYTKENIKIFTATGSAETHKIQIRISNLYLNGSKEGDGQVGIQFMNLDDSIVDHVWIENMGRDGIQFLTGSTRNIASNNIIKNCEDDGISLNNALHSIITGNILDGMTKDGIHIVNGSNSTTVSSNIAINNNDNGIKVSSIPTNSFYNTITGNIIENNNNSGIFVQAASYTILDSNIALNNTEGILLMGPYSTILSNNILINNTKYGSYASASKYVTIEGNYHEGNLQININLFDATHVLITNNHIMNSGTSNDGVGIKIVDSLNVIVGNNKIFDSRADKQQVTGVQIAGSTDYVTIIGNDLRDNRWNAIAGSCTNEEINHNLGYVTENSGTQTCSNSENIAHGLAETPTMIQVTPMNNTYDGVPVIATVDWSGVDGTNIPVGLYWTNGTAIATDIILVSWSATYEP